jgi:hypothetical protein
MANSNDQLGMFIFAFGRRIKSWQIKICTMRTLLYLLIFTIPTLFSCKNVKKGPKNIYPNENKTSETLVQSKTNNDSSKIQVKTFESYNWNKIKNLKLNLISELINHRQPFDKIINSFLIDYTRIENELNEILDEVNNYDSLNTIIYSDSTKVYKSARDFARMVDQNGFRIAFEEGNIFIGKNTKFLKSQTIDLVDSVSLEFINLYCNEIDSISSMDAGLVIPKKELINRIYNWGRLLDKTSKLEYNHFAESEFNYNLSLLFRGQDNTVVFDWFTKTYNQEFLSLMKETIAKYPSSKAAKEFKVYIDLLASQNYTRTPKISKFLEEKFK